MRYDIRETWDTTRQYHANETQILNESYSWIPVPRPESPDVGRNFTYKESQNRVCAIPCSNRGSFCFMICVIFQSIKGLFCLENDLKMTDG